METNSNKNLIRCNCGMPLVRRTNTREIEMVKHYNGEIRKVLQSFEGKLKILCDKCSKERILSFNKKTLPMTYCVVEPKNTT